MAEKAKHHPANPELAKLKAEIVKVSKEVKGQMGLFMKHVESGQEISIDADKVFPLGSVFKIPLMVEVLRQVDKGLLSMDEKIKLETRSYCIGSGVLQYLSPGLELSVRDLLTLMIVVTDNTASQMLWKRVGIQSVNMLIRELALAKTTIYLPWREGFLLTMGKGPYKDLTSYEAVCNWKGLSDLERMKIINEIDRDYANLSIEEFRKQYESLYGVMEEKKFKTQREYDQVFDNIGTPKEIGTILEKILKGEIVSAQRSAGMLALMMRSTTSSTMPQLLSPEVPVAAKAGITAGSVNNAGVIFISSTSHVVLCVFFKHLEEKSPEKAQAAQARMARMIYDHFSRVRT
ncbi:MAG TPA: serine hydrolase [Thermoplasmata archaeon]|nr:serine hydrolase [Thermoplasmata archaeon]